MERELNLDRDAGMKLHKVSDELDLSDAWRIREVSHLLRESAVKRIKGGL